MAKIPVLQLRAEIFPPLSPSQYLLLCNPIKRDDTAQYLKLQLDKIPLGHHTLILPIKPLVIVPKLVN